MSNTDGHAIIKVDADTDAALKKFAELNKEMTGLNKELTKEYQTTAKQSAEVFEQHFKVIEEQGKQHSEQIAKAYEKSFGRVSTAAKAAFTTAAAGITAVAAAGIKFNSDMESYLTSFTVMLGDAEKAQKHVEDLKNMAAKTPFGLDDLASASQTLQAFSVDINDVIPSLQQLGDISLGNKDRFNSLALVFGQVAANGKLMGQDLLQFVNAGFNPLQIMAEKTGKSMETLRDEMSKGEITYEMVADAIATATAEGGKFYNAMEEQSKTISGLTSTAYDNFKQLSGEIMEPITDLIRDELLPDTIAWMQSFDTEKAAQWLRNLLGVINNLTPVISGLTAAVIAYNLAITAIGAYTKFVESYKKAKAAAEGLTVAQHILNTTLLSNPIVLVTTLLAGLATALAVATWKAGENLREVEKLNSAYENNVADMEKSRQAAISNAEAIGTLADEVIALNDEIKAGGMTDEQAAAKKQELIDKVAELNSKSDDFQFTINAETGLLDQQTESVEKLTQAYVNMAIAKANADAYQQMLTENKKTQIEQQQIIDELEEKKRATKRGYAAEILKNKYKKEWDGFNEELQNELKDKYINENDLSSFIFLMPKESKSLEEAEKALKYLKDKESKINADLTAANANLYTATADYEKSRQELFGDRKDTKSAGNKETDKEREKRLKAEQDASKKAEDLRKQEFDNKLNQLKNALDTEQITQAQYYDRLEALNNQYFTKSSDQWLKYDGEVYQGRKKLSEQALKEQKRADEKFIKVLEDANKQKIDADKQAADKRLGIIKQLLADTQALWDDYENQLKSRADKLYNAVGYFDKPDELNSVSISSLQRNLDAKTKAYEKYFDDLQKLRERAEDDKLHAALEKYGLSDEDYQAFVATLEQMGFEDRDKIRAIAKAGDNALAKYIAGQKNLAGTTYEQAEIQLLPQKQQLQQKISELAETAISELNAVDENLKAELDKINTTITDAVDEYAPQAEMLGKSIADGIVAGLESRGSEVSQAMKDLLNAALDDSKQEMEIHSPSQKMRREVGAQMGKGVTLGIREQLLALPSDELIALGSRLKNAFNTTLCKYTPRAAVGSALYGRTMRTETVQTINNNTTSTVRIIPDEAGIFRLVKDEEHRQGDSF